MSKVSVCCGADPNPNTLNGITGYCSDCGNSARFVDEDPCIVEVDGKLVCRLPLIDLGPLVDSLANIDALAGAVARC